MSARPVLLEADLHAFVDGELGARDAAAVREHLARDEAAARRVGRWAAEREALRAQLAPAMDEPLPLRLQVSRMRSPADRARRERRLLAIGFGAGAAAGLIAAAALFALLG